eukprot:TRINITY_DN3381_c0_g1_i1.p1 TRINITY_DN3381_c0_g1~~TRINITY_DN3381_c0_g1_i1.p1  ORF type:complete len:167 (+),score=23.56 TRINITY_DN3381_c0_g1_i1:40-540(+)
MRLEVLREQVSLEESDNRALAKQSANQASLINAELQEARDRIEQLESMISSKEGASGTVPVADDSNRVKDLRRKLRTVENERNMYKRELDHIQNDKTPRSSIDRSAEVEEMAKQVGNLRSKLRKRETELKVYQVELETLRKEADDALGPMRRYLNSRRKKKKYRTA